MSCCRMSSTGTPSCESPATTPATDSRLPGKVLEKSHACLYMHRPDGWKLRECGGKPLSALPSSVQALAPVVAQLPPVMALCDGIVYNSLSGEALKAVEAKHCCPFVPSAGQTFYFKGNRMWALEDVPLEYFSQ